MQCNNADRIKAQSPVLCTLITSVRDYRAGETRHDHKTAITREQSAQSDLSDRFTEDVREKKKTFRKDIQRTDGRDDRFYGDFFIRDEKRDKRR